MSVIFYVLNVLFLRIQNDFYTSRKSNIFNTYACIEPGQYGSSFGVSAFNLNEMTNHRMCAFILNEMTTHRMCEFILNEMTNHRMCAFILNAVTNHSMCAIIMGKENQSLTECNKNIFFPLGKW